MRDSADHFDRQAVRDATDLVALIGEHVRLTSKGREHVGLCPFHSDSKPSLNVVTHKGQSFYKCFACGATGDAFRFVMDYHKMGFGEALRFLADRAGIKLTPRKGRADAGQGEHGDVPDLAAVREANAAAAAFFRKVLNHAEKGAIGREILSRRGISAEMIEAFMLGLAPDSWDALQTFMRRDRVNLAAFQVAGLLKARPNSPGMYDSFRNRLIFPICDALGRPIAFGARAINPEDDPKYLNSSESPVFHKSNTLYALHLAKRAIGQSKTVVVTEGYTDVIACHQAGFTNVVATLGTALTTEHVKLLRQQCQTVILIFDGDAAGQRATDRAVEVFFAEPIDVKICILPDGKDPDELLREPDGKERFRQALESARDAFSYKIDQFRVELRQAASPTARQLCLDRFLNNLALLGFSLMPGVRKRLLIAQLADMLGVPVADIERSMPRLKPTPLRRPLHGDPNNDNSASSDSTAPPSTAPFLSSASTSDETETPDAALTVATKSRRRAELELLTILITCPQAGLDADESGSSVLAAHPLEHYRDQAARAIAEAVYPSLAAQQLFTVQDLFDRLAQPQARSLASHLFLEGERRGLGETNAPVTALLKDAIATLHAEIANEEHLQRVADFNRRNGQHDSPLAWLNHIEHRREQGYRQTALSRGERS